MQNNNTKYLITADEIKEEVFKLKNKYKIEKFLKCINITNFNIDINDNIDKKNKYEYEKYIKYFKCYNKIKLY